MEIFDGCKLVASLHGVFSGLDNFIRIEEIYSGSLLLLRYNGVLCAVSRTVGSHFLALFTTSPHRTAALANASGRGQNYRPDSEARAFLSEFHSTWFYELSVRFQGCLSIAKSTRSGAEMMQNLPDNVVLYKTTPEFNQNAVPAGLQRNHKTAADVWGRIVVREGSLRYVIEYPETEEHSLIPGTPGIVEPQCPHHVVIDGPVRFCVEFYR